MKDLFDAIRPRNIDARDDGQDLDLLGNLSAHLSQPFPFFELGSMTSGREEVIDGY